jgi:hypothetical protein
VESFQKEVPHLIRAPERGRVKAIFGQGGVGMGQVGVSRWSTVQLMLGQVLYLV